MHHLSDGVSCLLNGTLQGADLTLKRTSFLCEKLFLPTHSQKLNNNKQIQASKIYARYFQWPLETGLKNYAAHHIY